MSERATSERVGVIGLGIIGSVWARHYEAEGLLASTWNRSQKDAPRPAPSAAAAARAATVLHVVVADPPAVREVLDQIEGELHEGHLLIQSTTIDPDSGAAFADRVRRRGAEYVEVPFMGSRPAAEQKQIVFLMGGAAAPLDRADAVLSRVSGKRHRVGTERQAASLKLAYNLQVAIVMEAISESLHASRQAGVADETFFGILKETALWSAFQGMKQPKLSSLDFSPQFSIKHMLKDVRLALGLAGGELTPAAAAVHSQLAKASEQGHDEEDIAALIRIL